MADQKADAARDALLDAIAGKASTSTTPEGLHHLAAAYALAIGQRPAGGSDWVAMGSKEAK